MHVHCHSPLHCSCPNSSSKPRRPAASPATTSSDWRSKHGARGDRGKSAAHRGDREIKGGVGRPVPEAFSPFSSSFKCLVCVCVWGHGTNRRLRGHSVTGLNCVHVTVRRRWLMPRPCFAPPATRLNIRAGMLKAPQHNSINLPTTSTVTLSVPCPCGAGLAACQQASASLKLALGSRSRLGPSPALPDPVLPHLDSRRPQAASRDLAWQWEHRMDDASQASLWLASKAAGEKYIAKLRQVLLPEAVARLRRLFDLSRPSPFSVRVDTKCETARETARAKNRALNNWIADHRVLASLRRLISLTRESSGVSSCAPAGHQTAHRTRTTPKNAGSDRPVRGS